MKRLAVNVFVVLLLLSVLMFAPLQFAKAERWVEVARYEGTHGVFTSEPFVCNYSEWRIRYQSTVETRFPMIIPGVYTLNITTYPQGEHANASNYIDKISEEPTQGRYYYHLIHNQTGTFYMNISTGYSDHYNIIVEQNVDSVLATPTSPATPSPTASNPEDKATWNVPIEVIYVVAVVAIIIIVLAVAVIRKKKAGTRKPM